MIRRLLERLGLLAGSLLLCTLAIFTLFEWFPSIPAKLHLQNIHYYALKERYLPDDRLVFTRKPFYRYEGYFVGDHYGLFSDKNAPRIPYRARFDENGFRNAPHAPAPDVILLGDSFLEFGLNETDTLAGRLAAKTGLSTANYGMEWYGPAQYVTAFKRFAADRGAKTAVLCFFEGNDLRDLGQYLNWKRGGDYYHFNLTRKNFFQRYLITLKDSLAFVAKLFLRGLDPRKVQVKLGAAEFTTVFSYPTDTRPAAVIRQSPEALELSKNLQEFSGLCRSRGIRPIVLFIPTKSHIYAAYTTDQSHPEWLKQKPLWLEAENRVEEIVHTLTTEAGAEWLSLSGSFAEAAARRKNLYYPTDTHWNSAGRQIAADVLSKTSVKQVMSVAKSQGSIPEKQSAPLAE